MSSPLRQLKLFFGLACIGTVAFVLSGCGGGGGGGGGIGGGGTSGPTAPPVTAALQVNDGTARALHQNVRAAFNNSGQGVIVWEENTGYGTRLLWAYFDGATLHPEQELVDRGRFPVVATNGTDFMLAWYSLANRLIHAAPCSGGGVLGIAVTISGDSGMDLDIASNMSGYAVVWKGYDSGSSQYRAFANIYSASSWTSAMLIDTASGGLVQKPRIASDGSSYAVSLWKDNSGFFDIYATISSGGTGTATWSAPALLENMSGNAYQPSITSNGNGFAVAWGQYDGTGALSVYANLYSSGSWSSSGTVLEGYSTGVWDVNNTRIASNGAGYVVAWSHSGGRITANIYSAGSWTAASVIDSGSNTAYNVTLASNGAGYLVAWQQDDGTGNYDIYSNLYSAGSWSTPALMDDRADNAQSPVAAPFPAAAGYALSWQQDDASGNPNLFGTIYAGGVWSSPPDTLVQGIWKATTLTHRMATSEDGITLAVWSETHKGGGRIMGNLNATGTWGAPFLIDGSSWDVVAVAAKGDSFMVLWYDPSVGGVVAADCASNGTLGIPERIGPATYSGAVSLSLVSNGTGYAAAWTQFDGGTDTNVYSNVYSSGSWSKNGGGPTPWVIEDGSGYPGTVELASNGSGYAAVWSQHDGVEYSIYANIFSSGTWSTGGTLLETGAGYAGGKTIASDGSGYAVTWEQNDGTYSSIYANIYSAGSWSTNGTLLENLALNHAFEPSMASDGTGYAAVWRQEDGPNYSIFANIYSSGSWSTGGTLLETGSSGAYAPCIASDGNGYAVAWAQHDGSYLSIYTNVYSAGTWSTDGTLVETNDSDAMTPLIISNGKGYSVSWLQRDPADVIVDNVWARLGL